MARLMTRVTTDAGRDSARQSCPSTHRELTGRHSSPLNGSPAQHHSPNSVRRPDVDRLVHRIRRPRRIGRRKRVSSIMQGSMPSGFSEYVGSISDARDNDPWLWTELWSRFSTVGRDRAQSGSVLRSDDYLSGPRGRSRGSRRAPSCGDNADEASGWRMALRERAGRNQHDVARRRGLGPGNASHVLTILVMVPARTPQTDESGRSDSRDIPLDSNVHDLSHRCVSRWLSPDANDESVERGDLTCSVATSGWAVGAFD